MITPEEFDAEWNRRAVAWDRVIGLLDSRLLDLAEQVSLLDASLGALIKDYIAHKNIVTREEFDTEKTIKELWPNT